MFIEIKSWLNGEVIHSIEADTLAKALELLAARGANLTRANLYGANLKFTNTTKLPTSETWLEYLTETLPALLVAGGKSLESFSEAWDCHEWKNCPMAHAFDVHEMPKVPILLRPRAEQFIQFFDAKMIPWPLPTKEQLEAK